jgi:hypothetical protein
MMGEHKNPEGAYDGDCEYCGKLSTRVKLKMVADRYLWTCVGGCVALAIAHPKRTKK